jgi:hypothetical protein
MKLIHLQLLLRGTIGYGTYFLSNRLTIGEALDDAAYNDDKLNWIGISLWSMCLVIASIFFTFDIFRPYCGILCKLH